jgi:hypothetical protein
MAMLGSSALSKLFVGSTEVSKAYLGANEVYSSTEYILDLYGTPECAYSFRDLSGSRSAFTSIGDTGTQRSGTWVVQIRKTVDDTQRSFTSAEVVDGTMEAWVGSGDACVTTWYDQSSNANHATQTVKTRQPGLVASGVLRTEGGLPAFAPDGVDDALNLGSVITGDASTFAVYRATIDNSPILRHLGGAAAAAAGRRSNGRYYYQTSAGTYGPADNHPSTQIAAHYQMVGTAQSIHANNSLVASRTTVANTANIGRLATYSGQTAGGSMSEVIIYNTDKSADRSDIFTNMMDYYSIT